MNSFKELGARAVDFVKRAIDESKRKAKAEREAEDNRIRKSKADAEAAAKANNEEMTAKYCPHVKGTCRTTCVHFEKSKIFDVDMTVMRPEYRATKPRCKTWKRG